MTRNILYLFRNNLLVALVYWGISWLTFLIFSSIGVLPLPLWPAAALALVAAYYHGWKIAPGLALGTILANHLALQAPLSLACSIAVMNTIGPLLGARLIYLICGRKKFENYNLRGGLFCFILAVAFVPILTATGGVSAKFLLGLLPQEAFFSAWIKWGVAHSLGTFFFTLPFFFILRPEPHQQGIERTTISDDIADIAIVTFLTISGFFWGADALFTHLCLPQEHMSFLQALFPFEDSHFLFMRLFVVLTFAMCTVVITRLIAHLLFEQQKYRKATADLNTTLNSIGDGVISTDTQARITLMNPVSERLTGWSQEDALGKPMGEIFHIVHAHTREKADNPIECSLVTGKAIGLTYSTVLLSKDGSEYHISESAAPIKNEKDEVLGGILVFRDMTEEYALQEQLSHSQRMDAIGQLAGGVAHDFNNMLGGVIGASELLGQKFAHHSEILSLNKIILDSALRAAELTKKLLAFARKQTVASSPIDVKDTIHEAIELLRNTIDRQVEIRSFFHTTKTHIIGDPSQLQNAFINLGINAAHAMPNGGILQIETREVELDKHFCNASQFSLSAGKYLEIDFRDNGFGIAPDVLSKIFDPFFTTKPQGQGTGLGLSAVYGTMQQHQGAVSVYSEVGRGTSFRLHIPLDENRTTKQSDRPPAQIIKGYGKILVVDDEDVIRSTAKSMLEDFGYEVILACNGQEGLETFQQEKDSLDMVLMDMVMPVMSGKDSFMAMKKIVPDVRVVLASGFSKEEDIEAMKKDGLHGFLLKPYRSVELSKAVHDTIMA